MSKTKFVDNHSSPALRNVLQACTDKNTSDVRVARLGPLGAVIAR